VLRLLADENFNNNIVRGVRRRAFEADIPDGLPEMSN
jgi:hypothetical protein